MKRLAAILTFLSACWVSTAYVVEEPGYVWCESHYYPDTRCDTYYVWVNQSYRYRGRWYGGRYVRRSHVRPYVPSRR